LAHRWTPIGGALSAFDFFDIAVDHGHTPTITVLIPKMLIVRFRNTYKVQDSFNLR
jgi:hypothetical protein